jgi:Tol biopolymer transport system component
MVLAEVDRSGQLNVKLAPRDFGLVGPRYSPDGRQVAFEIKRGAFKTPRPTEIGIYDLSGLASMRLLVGGGSSEFPIWSADGRRITFQSNREGDFGLFWQRADGNGPAERLTTPEPGARHFPDAWSPDGKTLLFEAYKDNRSSLWTLSLPDREIERFGSVESGGWINATFAPPHGRWVAYNTGEGAASRVYVEPFPRTGDRHVVSSTEPGRNPIWSRDGRELFYASGVDQFRAVTFSTQPAVRFGNTVLMSRGGLYGGADGGRTGFDLSPDGQRMLGIIAAQTPREALAPTIEVVTNWFEELKAKVP